MKHLDEISAQIFLEDGGTNPSVRDHLEECGDCRKLVKDYKLLFNCLSGTDSKDELSEDFTQKCMSEIENRKIFFKIIRISLYMFAGFLVMVLSFYFREFLARHLGFIKPILDFFTGFPKKLSVFGGFGSIYITIFFILMAVMLTDFFKRLRRKIL